MSGLLHLLLVAVAVVLYLRLGEVLWRGQAPTPGVQRLLRVLTAALPLLGLLGTVDGMITAFGALGEAPPGTGVATAASAGIADALHATQLGLAMALPALLLQAFLPAPART